MVPKFLRLSPFQANVPYFWIPLLLGFIAWGMRKISELQLELGLPISADHGMKLTRMDTTLDKYWFNGKVEVKRQTLKTDQVSLPYDMK